MLRRVRRWHIGLLLALWCGGLPVDLAHSQAVGQSHNTVPAANANFVPNLQRFLTDEPPKVFQDTWTGQGFVVSGCIHATAPSLTAPPSACVAYPAGYYITETGTVTYIANSPVCWVIANRDTSGNLNNFVRQGATHYLVNCTDVTKPTLPANSVWLMQVVTNSTSVTSVTDLRSFVPDVPTYLLAELPVAGNRGRIALVRDVGTGTLFWDTGSAWTQASLNPMTTAGDLIVGGANGVPTRLPEGTANQVLGVNTGATGLEYKSVVAGAGISVLFAPQTITIAQTVFPPTGSISQYVGVAAPSSAWLLCDGTAYNTIAQPALSLILIPNASVWGRGTPTGNFTYDNTTGIFSLNSHNQANGTIVHMANSGGALPSSFVTNTPYYIVNQTLNTFQLAATSGGAAIVGGNNGSGTNTLYNQVQVPDFRGRAPVGAGTGAGLTARTLGATTGKETIAVGDLPTHGHTVTDPGHAHTNPTPNVGNSSSPVITVTEDAAHNLLTNDALTNSNTTGITIQSNSCASCVTAADGNMSPALVISYIIKTKAPFFIPARTYATHT